MRVMNTEVGDLIVETYESYGKQRCYYLTVIDRGKFSTQHPKSLTYVEYVYVNYSGELRTMVVYESLLTSTPIHTYEKIAEMLP